MDRVLAVFTVGVGIMEALMFQFMGKVVDWLGTYTPQTLFAEKGHALIGMMAMVAFLPFGPFSRPVCACKPCKRVPHAPALEFPPPDAGSKPGLLSGRICRTRVRQSDADRAGVARVVMTVADMVVYVLVLHHSGVILSSFDAWLIVPFICWMIGFAMIMRFLIPKLGRTLRVRRCALADDRPYYRRLLQYATVKLFSTARARPLMPSSRWKSLW
ncbi:hypothetical protein KCG54_00020 [Neisseria subflava]|uniref:Uncharacterized protein n=1 Tax=Neisseria subflava TaxID=28449 RepID=A0A9X9N1P9_NEISU|nr:hypothetical protein [Neisseria subflava]UTG69812.1 hypothetical protein KCG54_00020 [Neisseria subflava]